MGKLLNIFMIKKENMMLSSNHIQLLQSYLLNEPTYHTKACIPAAVLVAFITKENGVNVIFTRRTMTVATHKGQVSLPGGVRDESDADDRAAALREANEEIGLDPSNVRVLGYLPGIKTITNFWITPVVGIVLKPFEYRPADSEVESVFEVSLFELSDKRNWLFEPREYNGQIFEDCRFQANEHVIWGATGKIIFSLIERIGKVFLA